MFRNRPGDNEGLFKSVMMAYAVLVLHVLLIAGLGLLVLFFRGVTQYMVWIFLVGAGGVALSGYLFYRRMRTEGRTLREMLRSPTFGGRAVEVSFLGGLASVRLGQRTAPRELTGGAEELPQLEEPETFRQRELDALLHLLERNLISPEEYQKAKKDILKS